jgi:choline dehydrogenase
LQISVSVLVIEHGDFDQGEPTVLIPGFYNPFPYFWKTPFPLSTPQPGLNSRVFFIPMGDVVGGGSAINAMFFLRGAKEEYENWKALGAHGWGWNDLLPYFKKVSCRRIGKWLIGKMLTR